MTRCANKKCAMPVDLRGSRACSISGIPYTTARVWSCTRFESAETPAEGCDWKPVITDSDENGEREIELRLSPTKQLLVTVTPDGLREPIVRHDDTGTYEHFVVLPAAQWAVVTGLVEKWRKRRDMLDDSSSKYGRGMKGALSLCARERDQSGEGGRVMTTGGTTTWLICPTCGRYCVGFRNGVCAYCSWRAAELAAVLGPTPESDRVDAVVFRRILSEWSQLHHSGPANIIVRWLGDESEEEVDDALEKLS